MKYPPFTTTQKTLMALWLILLASWSLFAFTKTVATSIKPATAYIEMGRANFIEPYLWMASAVILIIPTFALYRELRKKGTEPELPEPDTQSHHILSSDVGMTISREEHLRRAQNHMLYAHATTEHSVNRRKMREALNLLEEIYPFDDHQVERPEYPTSTGWDDKEHTEYQVRRTRN